jgi:hypothetical protein
VTKVCFCDFDAYGVGVINKARGPESMPFDESNKLAGLTFLAMKGFYLTDSYIFKTGYIFNIDFSRGNFE